MHILNVQVKYLHGGGPQICLQYTRALRRAGHKVTALVRPNDPFIEQQKQTGAQVMTTRPLGGPYDVVSMLHLWRLVKSVKPDVVVCHEGRTSALLKRIVGKIVPVVDVNHGRSPRQSIGMAATIVINSRQKKRTQAALGEDALVFFVPSGIDLSGSPAPVFPKQWHRPPVIGTMSRLVDEKALDVFIDALAILDKRGIKFQVRIAGEGEKREALRSQVKRLGLSDKVSMIGWVKNADGFYGGIDIFCLPSRQEEFGLVLLEAFKNGLPVVVADSEGPSEIVTDQVDGLIVPKNNPKALADALESLLLHKKKADTLAERGYDTLIENYSLSIFDRNLSEVLDVVVEKYKRKKAA